MAECEHDNAVQVSVFTTDKDGVTSCTMKCPDCSVEFKRARVGGINANELFRRMFTPKSDVQ